MNVKEIRWLVAAAGCAIPPVAHAYVDPGSAGLLVTSVLAAVAAAGYRLRRHWERVRRWFLKDPPARRVEPPPPRRIVILRVEGASLRDPAGRIYRREARRNAPARILRGVTAQAAEELRALLAAPWFRSLVSGHEVIRSDWLGAGTAEHEALRAQGWAEGVEHPALDVVTYPFEWPFSMLRRATLLQLKVLERALANGWLLKDAAPGNVQLRGQNPVFIDVLSFRRARAGMWWRGYRQLGRTALYPLMLESYLGLDPRPWLRGSRDGIDANVAVKLFGASLRKSVLSHVRFPAWAERRAVRSGEGAGGGEGGKGAARRTPRRIPPIRHTRALVRDLARLVEGLEAPAAGPWVRYPRQHAYGESDVKAKEAFVERHLRAFEAGTVWDLGANTGRYSVLASAHCERVVAIEGDPGAAERACRALEEACPERGWVVVADVTDLHPAPGFAGGEREALEARAPPDCVLCLALLHHLRITAGIALDAIVRWLGSLRARIILEWIDRTDGAFEALCARHGEAYPDYTREHLEREIGRYFQVVERQPLMDGKRTLLALRPREEGGGATAR